MAKKLKYRLIEWDLKDTPDIKEVQRVLKTGHIHFYEIDTGGDCYCWVASKTPLTTKQLNKIEQDEFYGEEE